jgi:hypothetical protein
MMENIEVVASEIWMELEEASNNEPPMNIKPYYDDMVKKEDSLTKALLGFKNHLRCLPKITSYFQPNTTGTVT